MALSIQTNYSSLITQSNLGKTNGLLATNQQRLGTGLRINSAADDAAAGLQIATRLNAQFRGMDVAMRNTSDAISLMQTADGAFSELTDITQRMKDLATQAANGTNSTDDGKALSAEFNELGKELGNIIANTKFAGGNLFSVNGTAGGVTFQIGADQAETLTVDVTSQLKAVTDAFGALTTQFQSTSADGTELETITGANGSIDKANDALDAIGAARPVWCEHQPPAAHLQQPGQHEGQHRPVQGPHHGRRLRRRKRQHEQELHAHAVGHLHAQASGPDAQHDHGPAGLKPGPRGLRLARLYQQRPALRGVLLSAGTLTRSGATSRREAAALGKWGVPVNVAALIYGVAAITNMVWPRTPDAPWYMNYSMILTTVIVLGAGLLYMLLAKP